MQDTAPGLTSPGPAVAVPPPRHGRAARYLGIHAVRLIELLGLLPLAVSVVSLARLSRRRLSARAGRRGRPRTYSDASILLVALIARTWQLSYPDVCHWLTHWPALAAACGFPPGRVIHPAQLSRRVRQLGPYPFWVLSLGLVWRAIRGGLIRGRDVVLDSTLLGAWTRSDPDAAWSYPTPKGRVFGYKLHVLLDRAARLPILFLLSPANRHDAPFAAPLLALGCWLLGLAIHVVRADGAYWGLGLVRFIVTVLGARPIIPFNRKRQPLARVRHLAWARLSYAARAIIERFFGVAKRHYQLDTAYAVGWEAVLLRVTLTDCSILVVALAAQQAGAPDLRLSPTRVLAHYLPVQEAA
jgi:hypothetical protein